MPCLRPLFSEVREVGRARGSGGDDVEGVDFGVEHGETVVVLLAVMTMYFICPALDLARKRRWLVCAEAGGVEVFREGFVVGDGDGEIVHDPLADVGGALAVPFAAGDGIESPVNEHAEAGLARHHCMRASRWAEVSVSWMAGTG